MDWRQGTLFQSCIGCNNSTCKYPLEVKVYPQTKGNNSYQCTETLLHTVSICGLQPSFLMCMSKCFEIMDVIVVWNFLYCSYKCRMMKTFQAIMLHQFRFMELEKNSVGCNLSFCFACCFVLCLMCTLSTSFTTHCTYAKLQKYYVSGFHYECWAMVFGSPGWGT